jgi:ATP-dependent RNA helicase RhlE
LTVFRDFGFAEPIFRALTECKYETPTPIQASAIPEVLGGRDLIGIAQTGTGKTAAFALPILNHLALHPARPERKTCRVLVLSPTRELSGQIADSFRKYAKHLRVSVTLAIGGVPIGKQRAALAAGIDVLVATPGRLLDLVRMGALRLDAVEKLVLDEADRMLDMGFIHDIRTIVGKLPKERQTLFFSATMPQAISELAGQMLRDPAKVAVTPVASTAERVDQRIVHVDRGGKQALLAEMLRSEPVERAIVFTRTKHGADKVVRGLVKAGISAEAIHGNKSQSQRERVLAAFRTGKVRTLVATDIAARGIDVTGISHVFNFDMPHEPESYVHRIGRTARAGAEGIAISFCDHEEFGQLRGIERLINIAIPATDRRSDQRVPLPQAGGHPGGGRPAQNKFGGRGGRNARNGRGGQPGQQPRRNGQGHGNGHGNGQGSGRNARHELQPQGPSDGGQEIGTMPFLRSQNRPQRSRRNGQSQGQPAQG